MAEAMGEGGGRLKGISEAAERRLLARDVGSRLLRALSSWQPEAGAAGQAVEGARWVCAVPGCR